MDPSGSELQELRQLLGELTARVFRIERALNLEPGRAIEAQAAFQAPAPPPVAAKLKPPAQVAPGIPLKPSQVPVRARSSTDLESRIGSHWLNRIGIAAVLIGVSYFLKYAFDNNWIGPAGRVTIGLLAGIAIVVWSERFRGRGYRIFSYSLKAVGIGMLYLSLYAAFQIYSLVPGGVAFVMMLAVTSATAVMAWTQDAEILAAFALLGGFSTPLLLSTGQNREAALFSYVVILDLGALALVIVKPWRRLLVLSYAGTLLLYIGWYMSYYDRSQLRLTVGFATLLFAIFAVAPLLANQGKDQALLSDLIPLCLILVNGAGYFLQIYTMFEPVSAKDTAWFALGFITVAIPIRLEAHWVTIGWFVEAAVLLWVADRVRSELLNAFAAGALALGVGRLLLIDNFNVTRPIFNSRLATYAVAIAVLGAVAWYGSRRKDETARTAVAVSVVALNLLALIALSREVADYYAQEMPNLHGRWDPSEWANWQHVKIARDFTYSALWMAYGAMLMVVGFWRRSAFVRWQALVLIAFTIGKVFLYDVSELDRGYRIVSFIVLGALLLAISFVYQRDWLRLSGRNPEEGSAGT